MRTLALCVLAAVSGGALVSQTTQGLISGRITDVYTGAPISAAEVSCAAVRTSAAGIARTDASGYYVLPLLSPGTYRIRTTANGYQAQEVHELDLAVAGRLDVGFRLRPLTDVWETGQYRTLILPNTEAVVTFYGPDVDTSRATSFESIRAGSARLESTISEVIDSRELNELPLAGRDAYTMIVTQPGVTADTATTRGLGFSVNGQRPSATNFLLDGLENENYLVTGPLATVAPEALQEYRISTNNFSAEYGRTTGFIANAITRAGTNQWHGLAYYYTKNAILNANDFQRNRQGFSRAPDQEIQPGFSLAGPIVKDRLYASAAFEYLRFRSREAPATFLLPSARFFDYTTPNAYSRRLLELYPPPAVASGDLPVAPFTTDPPSGLNLDRTLAVPRVDYVTKSGAHRLSGRVAISRSTRPDFIWSPYKDFISPLNDNATSTALTATSSLHPSLTNEARVGVSFADLRFDRPKPEVPTLATSDGTVLPGSPALYGYRNRSRTWEFDDNLLWTRGAHALKFGAGVLWRRLDGYLTAGSSGFYGFADAPVSFATDRPEFLIVSLSRAALAGGRAAIPNFDRQYKYTQFSAFAQDSFRVTSRLVLNYGARYENFGVPVNVSGVSDPIVGLGEGRSLPERLATAHLLFPKAGDERLYDRDNNNWAARLGFSYSLRENARTLLRGSYGIFYDRPFDNLWQNIRNNDVQLQRFDLSGRVDYLQPVAGTVAGLKLPGSTSFSELTMYQPGLRDGYVESYFAGVQHQVTGDLTVEVNALGSFARKLITTDWINRPLSVSPAASSNNPAGYFNAELGIIHYRANQGSSSYQGLSIVGRYRTRHGQFRVAYTWSHAIDNQSEPLAGEFFNLAFTSLTASQSTAARAAFSRQFDSRGDRGNSDFDQRHNIVFFSVWDIPAYQRSSRFAPVFRGWRLSQLAAVRSGLPYSVFAPSTFSAAGEYIVNNRADILLPGGVFAGRTSAPGGNVLLNASAFGVPAPGTVGNSGRNAFIGPAFFNLDVSVSRTFAVKRLGESRRVILRADVFNVLNHANLNNPDAQLGSPTFGVARYGRTEASTGFPLLTPLGESARQVQLMLRLEF